MGEVLLRAATRADIPRISLLGKQVFLDTYARAGIDDIFVREVEANVGVATLDLLFDDPAVAFVLAERGAYLLGFAHWTRDADHPLLGAGRHAELNRLYVQEASTGSGVGRALLGRVERDAAAAGAQALWLTAWVGNARALAFYARRGYSDAGSTQYTFEAESFENRLFVKPLAS